MANALGLSIGATQLVATPDDPQSQPVVRSSILTLHEDGPPEVGVPSQPGLTLTGFVGRVGDPVGIVAADGSVHRAEWALTEAMRVLIADAVSSANFTAPPVLSASIPAHWSPQTVNTLRDAIDRVPAFAPGGRQLKLIPDARAALESLAAGRAHLIVASWWCAIWEARAAASRSPMRPAGSSRSGRPSDSPTSPVSRSTRCC